MKNLRQLSTNTLDVKQSNKVTKHRRASFGNALSVDLAITFRKTKSVEFVNNPEEKQTKKKGLRRFQSNDETSKSENIYQRIPL